MTENTFGGWFKSVAATLQDVAGGVQKEVLKLRPPEVNIDVTFSDRALGLELDLRNEAIVRLVEPGSQAERHSVLVGDRLTAIDGVFLPNPGDVWDFADVVKTRMDDMPVPVVFTFARPVAEGLQRIVVIADQPSPVAAGETGPASSAGATPPQKPDHVFALAVNSGESSSEFEGRSKSFASVEPYSALAGEEIAKYVGPSAVAGVEVQDLGLGAWFQSMATTLQDVAGSVQNEVLKSRVQERMFDMTFIDDELGFDLEFQNAATVCFVEPAGHGEQLSLMKGDRLAAINSVLLPNPSDVWDFADVVRNRMNEMPRPVVLTFARPVAAIASTFPMMSVDSSAEREGASKSTACSVPYCALECDEFGKYAGISEVVGADAQDSSLGAWFQSVATTLQDVADGVQKEVSKLRVQYHNFDASFGEEALGFDLDFQDVATVSFVEPFGQGVRLGVMKGDRLAAIDGVPLPNPADVWDFADIVKTRMSHMPRPVVLTFARPLAEAEPLSDFCIQSEMTLEELVCARNALENCECHLACAQRMATSEVEAAAKAHEECEDLRADIADIHLKLSWGSHAEQDAMSLAQAEMEAACALSELRLEEFQAQQALRKEADSVLSSSCEVMDDLRERNSAIQQEIAALAERNMVRRHSIKEGIESVAVSVEILKARTEALQSRFSDEARLCIENQAACKLQALEEIEVSERTREVELHLEQRRVAETQRATAAAAADRMIAELRREVDRLRRELQRTEAAAELATAAAAAQELIVASAAAAQSEDSESTLRLASLRSERDKFAVELDECRRSVKPESSTSALCPNVESFPTDESTVSDLDIVANRCSPQQTLDPMSGTHIGVDSVELQSALAQVRELEEQKLNLLRKLNSRSIRYQFASSPADDAEADPPALVDRCAAHPSGIVSSDIWVLLVAAGRVATRRLLQCRKAGPIQQVEKPMRSFTKQLLRRPGLLWLFYSHILVLWTLESFCQASSQPTPYDPSTRVTLTRGRGKNRLI